MVWRDVGLTHSLAALQRVAPPASAAALIAVEQTGDDLDNAFDPQGARTAANERSTSAEERQRREGHAAAVLLRTAREAAQALQLPSAQHAVPIVDVPEMIERLGRAVVIMRQVDATAFRDAAADARSAFRWLSQHDVGDALEAAVRLEKDSTNAEADAVLRHRLGRLPADLAVLEGVRDGRTRDVPPWPGGYAPGTPTLRP